MERSGIGRLIILFVFFPAPPESRTIGDVMRVKMLTNVWVGHNKLEAVTHHIYTLWMLLLLLSAKFPDDFYFFSSPKNSATSVFLDAWM